ncbi:uncharacterized protein LOC133533021 [Cydia pomonella]|uniref:uncharacterized protein LOC133533021 n=1 Tax=Cydia pomonella TaxID=82600 RepID=UPI002ADE3D17|nr:uncharacterized protein LOC133533021 [Cydia pomonella]
MESNRERLPFHSQRRKRLASLLSALVRKIEKENYRYRHFIHNHTTNHVYKHRPNHSKHRKFLFISQSTLLAVHLKYFIDLSTLMVAKNASTLNRLVMLLLVGLSIGFVACEGFLPNNEFGSRYEANKINKGIWLRHRHGVDGRENSGHFFRSNSNENEPDAPFVAALAVREKRSMLNKDGKRHINSGKGLTKDQNSITSLFNDFPLSVAMLLENSNNKHIEYNDISKSTAKTVSDVENKTNVVQDNHTNDEEHFNYLKDILNITEGNATAKRSMKYDDLVVDRIDLIDTYNKSNDFDKAPNVSREKILENDPIPDKNAYEILQEPTTESATPRPITEKGLVKVLTMLTRTFKKIMKQHNAIKVIHDQMNNANKDFEDKIEVNSKKLNEFDEKYSTILKLVEKLNKFHDCLKNKEDMFKNKEEIMSKNMLDFENQQNKFLAQQQQFYNIQKMMLLQNEKINEKQNSIAKIQNEISHRQNHFARIFKKAKQSVQNNKYLKVNADLIGPKANNENNTTKMNTITTSERTTSIEPIKISLLSVPTNNFIENQDQMILKEKDDKSVDDLIYKYYFNNTFIDTIIKNKILGGIHIGDKTSIARSAKLSAKRNQRKFVKNATKPKTTLLFPVDKISFKRERRWINHHSTRKHRKRHHSKGHPLLKDTQNKHERLMKSTTTSEPPKVVKESDLTAKDPFLMMATSFCKEIGQNSTKQTLDWCVEKAIRRLSTLDRNMMAPNIVPMLPQQPNEKITTKPPTTPTTTTTTHVTEVPVSIATTPPALFIKDTQKSATKIPGLNDIQFFPDNQELEQNLKAFDLTPDTAGNVYFEGSLHASDIIDDKQSEGMSDVLPGYDSNSKIELDPKFIRMQLRKKHLQLNIPAKIWKN